MMEIGKKLEKNNNNDPIHNLLSTLIVKGISAVKTLMTQMTKDCLH